MAFSLLVKNKIKVENLGIWAIFSMYSLILTSSSLVGREDKTTRKTSSIELRSGGSNEVLQKEGMVEGGMVC